MFCIVVVVVGIIVQGVEFFFWIYIIDNYVQILIVNIFIVYVFVIFVYVCSFSVKFGNFENCEFVVGGVIGNMIYDWYIGCEFNLCVIFFFIGEIDIKEWMELCFGMLIYILLNGVFIVKQYCNYGYVIDSIVFVVVVQIFYVLDGQYMEFVIMMIMDIIIDGFGFMFLFGDFVWVLFIYIQQICYFVIYLQMLGFLGFVGVGVLLVFGFVIFCLFNSQKNDFCINFNDFKLVYFKYMFIKVGICLFIFGWWGIVRYINYFGDWFQVWFYSLFIGFVGYIILFVGSVVVDGVIRMFDGCQVIFGEVKGWGIIFIYFYVLYFVILLIYCDCRDDEKCVKKYGEDWEKYKKIVRWRIIFYIY